VEVPNGRGRFMLLSEPPANRHLWNRAKTDYLPPILNIFVPQVPQVPVVAGLPFFIVIAVGFFISFFALHFTQYASIVMSPLP